MVDAIVIKNFDPDPVEESDDGIDMVMLGVYISVGLVSIILILCIIMIV